MSATATALAKPEFDADLATLLAFAADFTDAAPEDRRLDGFDLEAHGRRCRAYRERLLDLAQEMDGCCDVGAAVAWVEIVDLVYDNLLRYGVGSAVSDLGPDAVVAGTQAALMAELVACEERGLISETELAEDAATDRRGDLAAAVDLARAAQREGRDGRVYVMLSEEDCASETVWDAAMTAGLARLDNIVVFVSAARRVGSSARRAYDPLAERFAAHGWATIEASAANAAALRDAVLDRAGAKPFVAICESAPALDAAAVENAFFWAERAPSADERAWAVDRLLDR